MQDGVTDVQMASLLFLIMSVIIFLWIMITRPRRRLITIPMLFQSVMTALFYILLISDSIRTDPILVNFLSATLRLQESLILFGIAIILLWRPDSDTKSG